MPQSTASTDRRSLPSWLPIATLLSPLALLAPLALLSLLGASLACAGPRVEPPLDSASILSGAQASLQQQDYTGAIRALEALTRREPQNARAWVLLGLAHHRAGNLEKALTAHLKAASFEATAPAGLYSVAAVYARQGDADAALEWLGKLQATGRRDVTAVAFDPDFQSIQDDPRLAALYPSAEQMADPFIEPVRILHEWVGEAPGDSFGWIGRNIGDVDGDGVEDLTTSAPHHGDQAGRIYVYSGRSGALLWQHQGEAGGQLGQGIEAAGDTNQDGIPDVIAGAPGLDEAIVFSGRDGSILLRLAGSQPEETFGATVADVGDFDGDGRDDVLVGAPANDAQGDDAGRAGIYSGRDGALLLELWGEKAGDAFGSTGAGAHVERQKLEGQTPESQTPESQTPESQTFIVVGAPNAGVGNRGRAYVYTDASGEPAFTIDAEETGRSLGGMFSSVIGDIDGDGSPDIYASDWADGELGPATGKIYVHSGATGKRLRVLGGEAQGDGFGIGPADAGDVDGDGQADLVVGAWQHGTGAPSGGKVYVYSGRDSKLLRTITCKVPGETFGFDATGMGDVNGDGLIDFLLTSAWSPIQGPRSGRMFIIAGEAVKAAAPRT